MENFLISINVVLPVFLTIALGYFLKKIKLVDDNALKKMNNIVFRVFIPILLFENISETDLSSGLRPKLMIFAVACIVSAFFVLCFIIPKIEKDNKRRGVLVQAIFRSNFVLFGLPICLSLVGSENAGVTALLISVIVPTFNFLAVISLELFKDEQINYKKILKGIITNPLILGSLVGILFLVSGLKLPEVLNKTIADLSNVATPLALVVLGGSFHFEAVKGCLRQLIIGIIGKLIIVPCIFIPLSIAVGFRGVELASLLVMFSAPTAINSFTMADQMGADSELAGQIVVFTSALSVLVMFTWVFITKSLGYI